MGLLVFCPFLSSFFFRVPLFKLRPQAKCCCSVMIFMATVKVVLKFPPLTTPSAEYCNAIE